MRLLPANTERTVQFELRTKPGSKVFVAGTFNNWSPTATPMKDNPDSGHFKTALSVRIGTHEYKFVVNGAWTTDPECPNSTCNGHGSLNSLLYA